MNARQNLILFFATHYSVGGGDHVPPASCLRSACCSAHAAAYADCTGRARSAAGRMYGTGRGPRKSDLFPIEEESA